MNALPLFGQERRERITGRKFDIILDVLSHGRGRRIRQIACPNSVVQLSGSPAESAKLSKFVSSAIPPGRWGEAEDVKKPCSSSLPTILRTLTPSN